MPKPPQTHGSTGALDAAATPGCRHARLAARPRVLEKPNLLSLGQVFFSCVFKSWVLGLRRSLA
ncbi:MAG: hypothetical protein WCP35_07845, partial [Verrucomicrobiota bacterium]